MLGPAYQEYREAVLDELERELILQGYRRGKSRTAREVPDDGDLTLEIHAVA